MWITIDVAGVADTSPRASARARLVPADSRRATRRTVLLRADGATPLGTIAAALAERAHGSERRPGGRGRGRSPGAVQGAREPPAVIHVDGAEVDPGLRLDASPLRDGSVLRLGAPLGPPLGAGRNEPVGLVELRVTGGPGAGMVHRLLAGEYGLGSDPAGGVVLRGHSTPRRALSLRVGVDGSCTITPRAGATVWIDGCRRDGPVSFPAGERGGAGPRATLRVGGARLLLTVPDEPDALLQPAPAGPYLEISREPRMLRAPGGSRYRLPTPPVPPRPAPPPVLATLLPAAAATGMAVLLHAYYLLLFAALAPLSLVGSYLAARRQAAREHQRELAEYQRIRAEIDRDATAALDREAAALRRAHPDPAATLLRALGPRRGLWERRPEDPDFLHLRVGTGDLPGGVVLDDPAAPDHRRQTRWQLRDVPVTVPLPETGVLGVVGAGDFAGVVGSWLTAQAAVHHSPRDLAVHLVVGTASPASWEWARWLPHCRPPDGPPGAILVGADGPGRARRVDELASMIDARLARTGGGGAAQVPRDPAVLVVVEGAASMRAALIPVLRSGPLVGVYVVCLERDPRLLPPECHTVVEQVPGGMRVRRQGAEGVDQVCPDLVAGEPTGGGDPHPAGEPTGGPGTSAGLDAEISGPAAAAWCEQLARALAPVRDPGPRERGPASAHSETRLLELLDLDPPTARALAPRWITERSPGPVPIGVCPAGLVSLDLSRDGPHALVAGTTGSGKSEFLQSLVASLAVRNRPDEMTFVLVDYKGGSAFGDCAHLPHTVGLVTDLDPHLVRRALDSLAAELRRREALLADAGCKDIDDYSRAPRPSHPARQPLPRLVVVIDEFAALVRELPEFVSGLVGLAGRGRSLGIHLVLATQRPAGVVSPEIMANTNLRVALRVTDQAESIDVLGLPDAALIPGSSPGQAIVRVGQGSPLTFQTGRIGGSPRRAEAPAVAPVVIESPWPPPADLADTVARAESIAAGPGHEAEIAERAGEEPTDLRALARALREASRICRVPGPRRPWLPPLPVRITIDDLPTDGSPGSGPGGPGLPPVPLALADLCLAQAQPVFAIDLEHGSHLMILGSPRSGRSTVLRTFAGSLARAVSPADVHVYGLDCGNNSLAPLTALPHTGAVVGVGETERVHRLLARLADEVTWRQEVLAAGGFADLAEARLAAGARTIPRRPGGAGGARPGRLPYLVLLLDGYEGFLASFESFDGAAAVDRLLALARDGPAVGLRILVTTDRRGLTGRLPSTMEQRLVLRMAERADYGLAGLAGSRIPDALPPGRGFLIGGPAGRVAPVWRDAAGPVELQVALLTNDPAGSAQAGMLRRMAAPSGRREPSAVAKGAPVSSASPFPRPHTGPGPGRAPRPQVPRPQVPRPFRVDVLPSRISAREIAELQLTGPEPGATAGPGRRVPVILGVGGDELAPVGIDLDFDGPGFVVAGPSRSGRSSTLMSIGRGLLGVGSRLAVVCPRLSPLRGLIDPAVVQLVEGMALEEALRRLGGPGQTVVLVDDAELVSPTPLGDELAAFLRGGHSGGLVAAGTTEDLAGQFRGFLVDARRSRSGLLLSPGGPADGDLLGVRLPRTVCGPGPPGRGLLVRGGTITPVQVVEPSPEEAARPPPHPESHS
ncbi:cell division protein FtsK [Frankia sp. Mgl5]|uniref:FtsK/SpoIIIE domain-containing protein n=1 Tax=Frankia sp. Mgl5 TaxID=2933793 RepID=UPI00200EBCFE|nr:FtsK/SpoIIIE domain-containing protein [Frankia sp. Mgl5]MCK9928437.1 cell division protein FtsK [Frankia sp. Mgl5]